MIFGAKSGGPTHHVSIARGTVPTGFYASQEMIESDFCRVGENSWSYKLWSHKRKSTTRAQAEAKQDNEMRMTLIPMGPILVQKDSNEFRFAE